MWFVRENTDHRHVLEVRVKVAVTRKPSSRKAPCTRVRGTVCDIRGDAGVTTEEPDANTLRGPLRGVDTAADLIKPCSKGPFVRICDAAAVIKALTLSMVVAVAGSERSSEAGVIDCAAARGM
jgi:hypothetical protein